MDIQWQSSVRKTIEDGQAVLGIELGSTRIKAVLIDSTGAILGVGVHSWESELVDGFWTYSIEDVLGGLQASYLDLKTNVSESLGVVIRRLKFAGISAMMHGYLAFDADDQLLTPFRTWRNTTTGVAAAGLSELFQQNIPQRWSIAHLYQAMLNGEEHVDRIAFLTTLAGYVHWKLTGERVLGVGDASGMFPIAADGLSYDQRCLDLFAERASEYSWDLASILPRIETAGRQAGALSVDGAALLDPSGDLEAGAIFCPPEGDAGTGMVATHSVAQRTGNISVGTSVFGMIVLEKALSGVYEAVDIVTTPHGKPVAMIHCNNGTSDLDAWLQLFAAATRQSAPGGEISNVYDALLPLALDGDRDADGIVPFNFVSGEPVLGLSAGVPLLLRQPDSRLTLANFFRSHLMSMFATLAIGIELLKTNEDVAVDHFVAHGGIFKTKDVAQVILAAALESEVRVNLSASEGGAWGIALLANFVGRPESETLDNYLDRAVFTNENPAVVLPSEADCEGYARFLENYRGALSVQPAAIDLVQR